MNTYLFVKFILTRGGVDGIPVSSPPQRILGTAPETTGGRTSRCRYFLTILGRTRPNGRITDLRLFGTAGITVKVCQPAGAIVELVGRCFQLVRLGVLGDVDVLPMSRLGHGDIFDRQAATAGLRR